VSSQEWTRGAAPFYVGVMEILSEGWRFVRLVAIAPMLPMLNPMLAKTPPGFFLANMGIIGPIGSLIGHLIWGTVLGAVYGGGVEVRERAVARSEARQPAGLSIVRPQFFTSWRADALARRIGGMRS
jgi:hypothetical protein